jgi:tryprostatin B 6-hydroxylase
MVKKSGQKVNVGKWFNCYSFDVMGDLTFNKDFGLLNSGEEQAAIALLHKAIRLQELKVSIWLFRMVASVPGLTRKYWEFREYCGN